MVRLAEIRLCARFVIDFLINVLDGDLVLVAFRQHPVFNVGVPQFCSDVPAKVLNPEQTWTDKTVYEAKARELAGHFHKNFEKFQDDVGEDV